MMTVLFVFLGIFLIGIILFIIAWRLRQSLLPSGEVAYSDTGREPGEIIESTSLPLVGKPDYIIKKDAEYIPVEVKTGKTPAIPYKNHIAQLFAYCLLVEEKYGSRPSYGIIKYPEKEFPLEFTKEAEQGVRHMVQEVLEKKQNGTMRDHMQQICRKCREGVHTG